MMMISMLPPLAAAAAAAAAGAGAVWTVWSSETSSVPPRGLATRDDRDACRGDRRVVRLRRRDRIEMLRLQKSPRRRLFDERLEELALGRLESEVATPLRMLARPSDTSSVSSRSITIV